MKAIKTHTLSIKTGEYEHEGKTKNKYLYVGVVMKNVDGSSFLLLDKTFNPAGIVDDRENVLITMIPVPVKKDSLNNQSDATTDSEPLSFDVPF